MSPPARLLFTQPPLTCVPRNRRKSAICTTIAPSAYRSTLNCGAVVAIGVRRRGVGRDKTLPANAAAYLSSELGRNVSTGLARIGA
jgi:hypothetical protein